MKRLILGVCAVVAAAALVLSVCGSKSEQTAELFTDNVEALTEPEAVITVGRLCMLQNSGVCLWVFAFGDRIIYDYDTGEWA